MTYPPELEDWWLTQACKATGCNDHVQAILRLEPVAGRLSDQFTVDRPEVFTDYFADRVSLSAYGILFFPQTFARSIVAISELMSHCDFYRSNRENGSASIRVLDLGCGTGASTLAAAHLLNHLSPSLHAVDRSTTALTALRQVFDSCRSLWPAATLEIHASDARADGLTGAFDLILACFTLNELFSDAQEPHAERWLHQQLDRLAPQGALVILEPAGTITCERLQRFRNRIAGKPGFSIAAPCLHQKPCPMLGANCGFCHDVRSWRVPDSVNLINRRLFRSVHDLKHGLLIVQRATPPRETQASLFRMVGPINRDKARVATYGCCGDGTLRKIEQMTRGLSRPQIDALASHERGDCLRLVNPRLLGDGRTWRVEALEPAYHPAAH